MNKVSDLTDSDKIQAVLTAFKTYRTAVNNDALSQVSDDAKLPDAQVFYHNSNGGIIIILPERHDSTEDPVQGGAASVAKYVMEIPRVKIAVEEPINYYGTLLSNVGWAKDVSTKPQSTKLFDFEASAQGSISHQIYTRQVYGMVLGTSRYAAEKMPRDPNRYNNPEINTTMVRNLDQNTGAGDISVFPVGPDHLSVAYDRDTLGVHLQAANWKLLSNE
ncbi:hypothetical protein ACJJIF_05250 [Microbulbifer sp. SSSA002]|uniref:hypothetical protein n=1 Tax=Microbulbifer sp. SSSA002 TaxID=3243376 RepID=UPI00403A1B18